jgi:hypothetical protein
MQDRRRNEDWDLVGAEILADFTDLRLFPRLQSIADERSCVSAAHGLQREPENCLHRAPARRTWDGIPGEMKGFDMKSIL